MSKAVAVCLISMLMMLFQCSIVIFVSAMPLISQYFHTSPAIVQMMPTVFMLGFGVSGLIYGVLADHYGRRGLQLAGVVIFIIGCLIAFLAPTIGVLLLAILLQGAGIGSQDVLGRAILADLFDQQEFADAASTISMVSPIMPILAPLIGGYITQYYNWRFVFILLLLFGVMCLLIIAKYLTETHRNVTRTSVSISQLVKQFLTNANNLLLNKVFIGFVAAGIAANFGFMAFNTIGPFIIQQQFNYTPVAFSWLSAGIGCGLFIGGAISKVSNKRYSVATLVKLGLLVSLCSSLCMLVFSLLGVMNAWVVTLPTLGFLIGGGIVVPNVSAGAIAPFADIAGAASAIQGGGQNIMLSLLVLVLVGLPAQQISLALALFLVSLLVFGVFSKLASSQ